ncbi:hypothetical protein, partial [Actinomadura sp. NPDC000600]|uniref:hypothetical protein n=1 Tax=Actinomadura sp. NPDC000600 TaxID=3154262 RepID=UPI003397E8DD
DQALARKLGKRYAELRPIVETRFTSIFWMALMASHAITIYFVATFIAFHLAAPIILILLCVLLRLPFAL